MGRRGLNAALEEREKNFFLCVLYKGLTSINRGFPFEARFAVEKEHILFAFSRIEHKLCLQ